MALTLKFHYIDSTKDTPSKRILLKDEIQILLYDLFRFGERGGERTIITLSLTSGL